MYWIEVVGEGGDFWRDSTGMRTVYFGIVRVHCSEEDHGKKE
jgi:hypothetical protein